jgi:tetratricopeptide (TPR) repeat protein
VELADARSAYERASGDPAAALAYGDRLLKANKPAEARPVFEKLITGPAGATPAQMGEAHFQMGQVWLKERNYDKALESWGVVLDRYAATPRASHATINTAAVLYQVKDQNARAFEVLEAGLKAGRINQEHLPTAYYLQYSIYFDAKDYTNARRLLKELPTEGDRHEHAKESIPVVLWKSGEVAEARRLTADLYERAKDNANALNNLSAIFVEHGLEIEQALQWAERAVELSGGTQAYVLDTYADALFANGLVDRAIAAEEKAVALARQPAMKDEFAAKLEKLRAAKKKASRPEPAIA